MLHGVCGDASLNRASGTAWQSGKQQRSEAAQSAEAGQADTVTHRAGHLQQRRGLAALRVEGQQLKRQCQLLGGLCKGGSGKYVL